MADAGAVAVAAAAVAVAAVAEVVEQVADVAEDMPLASAHALVDSHLGLVPLSEHLYEQLRPDLGEAAASVDVPASTARSRLSRFAEQPAGQH